MAARITFSCSDELKAELEAYAEKHGANVSKAVCDALELLLHPSPAPTPVPTPGPPPPPPSPLPPPGPDSATLHQLQQHRVYLEALGQHTEYRPPVRGADYLLERDAAAVPVADESAALEDVRLSGALAFGSNFLK